MHRSSIPLSMCFVLLALFPADSDCLLVAQDAANDDSKKQASGVVTFSTQDDHQDMQKQLGITKLRPGPSGDSKNPNAANTDESKANPYPNLPDLMTLKDGTKVTTREQWWKQRRPEIVEDFEREVLGKIPEGVPKVTWKVLKTIEKKLGETEVIEKRLVGRADNSGCPEIDVNIMMSIIVPKERKGPVPALMQFGFTSWGLDGADANFGGRRFGEPRPGDPPSKEQQLVEAGWAAVTLNANSIQEDSGGEQQRRFGPPRPEGQTGGGLTRGIIGLTNKGMPRKPDQWGSLRAWGWGASRGLDYLETESTIDAKKVGIDGVSRYGKAALVTMAFDERFAMALVGSSGEGGASLYRRNFGEAVENLTGSGEYHWMAGNFLKYGTAESTFGSKNASDLPVDAHMLIALCAPRMTFISYGVPEKGDALWLDQQGSFMATIAAQPAFRLLGARDLGRSDDYSSEKMPPVNTDLLDGELAWRQHDGGHTDLPNIPHFVQWAKRIFGKAKADVTSSASVQATGGPNAPMPEALQKSTAPLTLTRLTTPGGAEIPDAVRIKRPTTDEIAIAERGVAAMIESADPRTKAIFKEYPTLLEVRPPRPNTAVVPNLAPFFRQKHESNVNVAKKGEANLLFLGDSITDFWRNESGAFAGKKVFDEYFGKWNVANFGIAGDTTQGVLYRLQHGEGEGFSPTAVMLMIGTNNSNSNSAPEIAEGIGAIVLELQKRFPKTKILLLGIFPRGGANDKVRTQIKEINQTIAKLHDGMTVHFMDIGHEFLDADGNIPKEIMGDALHPSPKGYEIWAKAVAQKLHQLMGS